MAPTIDKHSTRWERIGKQTDGSDGPNSPTGEELVAFRANLRGLVKLSRRPSFRYDSRATTAQRSLLQLRQQSINHCQHLAAHGLKRLGSVNHHECVR
jgi:hypothetical protein